jgi:O-antigen/teichoic acid export membrane protein
MSTAVCTKNTTATIGDSFARGVMVMLVINLGQRVVGLLRNFGFCQFLTDSELGHWALASSFFMLAAPLLVLGLPGSFGKFVEHYRQRGCLQLYLTRTATTIAISTAVLALMMLASPELFSWLVYRDAATTRVVTWTVIALIAQIGYNVVYELTLSLRQVRAISWMQFTNGVSFAIISIFWLILGHDWASLLASYAIACLLGMSIGVWSVWANCSQEFVQSGSLTHRELWPRILPFAAALWLTNLLANTFDMSDRYMLLHFAQGGVEFGQSLVGQYYCGRIMPNLVSSLALMLSGLVLPYISADWEAGAHDNIRRRMMQVLSVASLVFTGLGVAALLVSPILFEHYFAGRYAVAQSILGLSFIQCIWQSTYLIASSYLVCAERAKLFCVNLAIGLAINIGLNWPLIYYFGVYGAVTATMIANFVVMMLTFGSIHSMGCNLGARTLILSIFPVVLLCGPIVSAFAIAVVFFLAGRTELILTIQDRKDIDSLLLPKLARAGVPIRSLWP